MERLTAEDPRRIGAYRLLGRLGAGGMGRVYLARSERGRTVAVKLVRPELAERDEFRDRFRQEVAAARRVGGEWTAPVLDADTEAAAPWVATGYVAGPSLEIVVGQDHGPLPERSVCILANRLARALEAIHGAGIIHRDLKPANVLLALDGPRVIDFGIARALDTATGSGITQSGVIIGSPSFMSPEQVRGNRLTPASDIFAMGAVLVYAATGRLPFNGPDGDSGAHTMMFRIAHEEPELGRLAGALRELVASCLAKAPEERPSVADVLARTAELEAAYPEPDAPWLPAGLLDRLGRHAVELLEVESEAEAAPAPGGFGPPPTGAYGPVGGAAGTGGSATLGLGPYGGTPVPVAPPGVAQGPGAVPAPTPTPAGAPAPYGGGESTTQQRPRRRAFAPAVVAAAVAGTLLLGAGVAWSVLRDGDDKGGTPAAQGASPGASGAPGGGAAEEQGGGAAADAEAGTVPPAFVGTWVSTQRRVVLSKGKVGDTVAAHMSVGDTYLCQGTGKLLSADAATVTFHATWSKSTPAGKCKDPGETVLRLNPDGSITWTPKDGRSVIVRKAAATTQVPSALLGTWQRKLDSGFTQKVTIKQGAPGGVVMTLVADDGKGKHCEATAEFFSSSGNAMTVGPTVVTVSRPAGKCDAGGGSTFSLSGKELRREFFGGGADARAYAKVG
ncbi:serine/threonine-protein kinase [Streptomyces sp. URMC 123]|uniref:serine/threonine-protein kinase n=1 Tax=Streptomyces sp. URMC 123 TaxID=3423403 RepID=UPI003F1B3757